MRVVLPFLILLHLFPSGLSFINLRSVATGDYSKTDLQMSQIDTQKADLVDQVALLNKKVEALTAALFKAQSLSITYPTLPAWYEDIKSSSDCSVVDEGVREWDDESWRLTDGGFSGTDFVHSRSRAPVRVLEYLIVNRAPAGNEASTDLNEGLFHPSLVGPAYFSSAAESHKGLCHGGSMCALMDDAIGWMGFCMSGRPRGWTGFTVQVCIIVSFDMILISERKCELCKPLSGKRFNMMTWH